MSLSRYLKRVVIGFNVNIDEDVFAGLTRCLECSLSGGFLLQYIFSGFVLDFDWVRIKLRWEFFCWGLEWTFL